MKESVHIFGAGRHYGVKFKEYLMLIILLTVGFLGLLYLYSSFTANQQQFHLTNHTNASIEEIVIK